MRAVVIHAAGDLRLENHEAVDAGAHEVLVRIERGGICGSDLHYFNHGGFGTVRLRQPMVLGHEVSGRVASVGVEVKGLRPGDLVAVSPSRPCRQCRYCLERRPNHCLEMKFYGSAMPFPHIQGAFQDYLVVSPAQCVVASGLDVAAAAMAEPLAVCLHGMRQAGPLLGKRVLVTGSGPIGVLSVLAARRAGATEIVATDVADFTLGFAASAGADRAINVAVDPEALAKYAQDKGHFDVQLECSGNPAALAAGVSIVRPGGTIVQLGMGGDMSVPMQQITAKELTVRGSFRFHAEFATAVELMQKGLIDPRLLLTHTLPVEEVGAAFRIAGDRSQAMKVQLAFA